MSEILVNKIEQSGLITIDLQKMAPDIDYVDFDLKPFLFRELILREKDFRQALKALDTTEYMGKTVLVYCSVDVIIPMWVYMLIATRLYGIAVQVLTMSPEEYTGKMWYETILSLDISEFKDKKVILKGCSDIEIPPAAYSLMTWRLLPTVQSLMYGEPCSTVPVFKKR